MPEGSLSAPVTSYHSCSTNRHGIELAAVKLNVRILNIINYLFLCVYGACVIENMQ
jgi:hypothetical protein